MPKERDHEFPAPGFLALDNLIVVEKQNAATDTAALIIPAAFASTYPALGVLNVMHLATPQSAILSAVIFNALIIIGLIPLALKGVRYRPLGAAAVLRRNLWIYGVGGILIPFPGIKLVDMILVALGLV